jgi:hypothetical protein
MEVPDAVPEPARSRLRFQADGADVQFAISKLMQSLHSFLSELLTRSGWRSPADDEAAAGFVDEYWHHKRRWARLQPPDPFRSVWAAIDQDLEKLGVVMEKLSVLGAGDEKDFVGRVQAVQEDLRAELDRLATDEDKLFALEREQRDTES